MRIDTREISNVYADMLSNKKIDTKNLDAALKKATGHSIYARVISVNPKNMFVMCITPDKSTVDKIAKNIVMNESQFDLISDLWKKASSWSLDIDKNLFDFLSAGELTALTLHEIGHMIEGNSIPARLSSTVQVALANSKIGERAMMKDSLFNKIMHLPIIATCYFNPNKESIKHELKADKVAVHSGYMNELLSAMDKIQDKFNQINHGFSNPNADLDASLEFTKTALNNLEARKSALVKKSFKDLRDHAPEGSALFESASFIEDLFFEDAHASAREKWISDLAERISHDEYVEEFGGGKGLKPITRDQIDYIRVKVSGIETLNDKLMMVSYINGKIELAEYYISILEDPNLSKKYKVPHSMSYLTAVIDILNKQKEIALKAKIVDQTPKIIVGYPEGYEG